MEGCQRNRVIRSSSRKINNNNNNKNNNSSNQVHCQGCSHKPWIVSGHKPYIPLNRHFEKLRPRKQKMTRSRGARPLYIGPCKWPSHVLKPNQFPHIQLLKYAGRLQRIRFYVPARWRPRAAVHARKWLVLADGILHQNTIRCSSPARSNSWMLACHSVS